MPAYKAPDWRESKRFVCNGIAVSVRRDHSVDWPKFTLKIGDIKSADGAPDQIGAYVRVFVVRDSAMPCRLGDTFERLSDAIAAAEGFIAHAITDIESVRIDALAARDLAKAKYGPGAPQRHPTISDKRREALRAKERKGAKR